MKKPSEKALDRKLIARTLRALASTIEKADPDEIDALASGRSILEIRSITPEQLRSQREHRDQSLFPKAKEEAFDPDTMKTELLTLSSRDEGLRVLSGHQPTRKDLEALARATGTAILKTDNMELISEKIIENCIGARLNSLAIRGAT